MKIQQFQGLQFRLQQHTPILFPPFGTPLIADPTVLLPTETPDRKWHLFAHTFLGIQQFTSADGVQWQKVQTVVRFALRPFIFKEDNRYYIFYEKFSGPNLVLPGKKWYSQLELRHSDDLKKWSAPSTLVVPSLHFHRDAALGEAVSNPCLIKTGQRYRLYFSCSLVRVPDCGFNEPLHISYAESDRIDGDYVAAARPVFSPSPEMPWNNLGAGSMKVITCEDGYVAFQNGIYAHNGRSGSAICLLHSSDGIAWQYLEQKPLLAPDAQLPWMGSHIYACDPKIYDGKLYLYFNARNHAHWSKGSEKIGLAIAEF